VFFGLRAVVPHLREAGGGKIIVLGSAASRRAGAGLAHYASTKAAVSALVRVAARDLRGDRIAVNELQPGPTATAMHGVEESDPDTLAEREVVLSGEGLEDDQTVAGEWFKSPRNVAEFALYLATLPNHGPSGQIFSYNSPV
jgi:3-oxoacyl-[acyl-carrier protein] reductase